MKKTVISCIILAILFINCNSKTDSKINSFVENQYIKNENVNFSKLLSYDYLYVFREGTTNDSASKAIGFKYNGDKDISRLIVFTKGKNIIFEQTDLFSETNQFVNFNSNTVKFDRTTLFTVEKDEYKDAYFLTPIAARTK
jgi:hypothetical protein